jgi:hypothetical protein
MDYHPNTTDLRINNIVFTDKAEPVLAIFEKGIKTPTFDYFLIKNVLPVLIDISVLEAFGFTRYEKDGDVLYLKDMIMCEEVCVGLVAKPSVEDEWVVGLNDVSDDYQMIYVHELQNLYYGNMLEDLELGQEDFLWGMYDYSDEKAEIHEVPLMDTKSHSLIEDCKCCPIIDVVLGIRHVRHSPYDGRQVLDVVNKILGYE